MVRRPVALALAGTALVVLLGLMYVSRSTDSWKAIQEADQHDATWAQQRTSRVQMSNNAAAHEQRTEVHEVSVHPTDDNVHISTDGVEKDGGDEQTSTSKTMFSIFSPPKATAPRPKDIPPSALKDDPASPRDNSASPLKEKDNPALPPKDIPSSSTENAIPSEEGVSKKLNHVYLQAKLRQRLRQKQQYAQRMAALDAPANNIDWLKNVNVDLLSPEEKLRYDYAMSSRRRKLLRKNKADTLSKASMMHHPLYSQDGGNHGMLTARSKQQQYYRLESRDPEDTSWAQGAKDANSVRWNQRYGLEPRIPRNMNWRSMPEETVKNASLRRRNRYRWALLESESVRSLPEEAINSVEKFVFFAGYPRSGHSIIGSMMDAHPNMIISHELMLFKKLTQDWKFAIGIQNKAALFNAIYRKSLYDVKQGWHNPNMTSSKGYTLAVGTPWHGKYNRTLKVIGDKSGGQTAMAFNANRKRFEAKLGEIRKMTNVPFRVIHVVRNPYDMIATSALYATRVNATYSGDRRLHSMLVTGQVDETVLKGKYKKIIAAKLRIHSSYILKMASGVHEMIRTLNLTVLEIHSEDFVRDPRKTISRICAFLDVPCPEDYLQACYDKAYKTSSKSRNLVAWPEDLLADVQAEMDTIPFLRRYAFEGD